MAERSERLKPAEPPEPQAAHGESRFAVLAANMAIAIAKLVAGLMTGSAEAVGCLLMAYNSGQEPSSPWDRSAIG